jgi:hypothetical protein
LSRTKGWSRTTDGPGAGSVDHLGVDQESQEELSGDSPSPADKVIHKNNGRCDSGSSGTFLPVTGGFGHSNRTDQASDSVGEPSPENSADAAGLSSDLGQHYHDPIAYQAVTPTVLPPITGDSKNIAPNRWESLSASERVAFLQRWLMYAEVKYKCPVDHWPEAFAAEWLVMKSSALAFQCLIDAEQKVAAGKSVLNYVARAMEGDLPHDAEQWRVLYVQAYLIAGIVNRACTRLQCKIDAALMEASP